MPYERVLHGGLAELQGTWTALPAESKRGALVLLVEMQPPAPAKGTDVPPPPPPPPGSGSSPAAKHHHAAPPDAGVPNVARILLRGGVRPQQAALLAAQLTGAAMSAAQRAVESEVLGRGAGVNPADALPAGVEGTTAQHTLHLVNLGPHLTREELASALAALGAAGGDLSLTDNHHGDRIAFVRFATPEAASDARTRINIASIMLGSTRPARRERWLG